MRISLFSAALLFALGCSGETTSDDDKGPTRDGGPGFVRDGGPDVVRDAGRDGGDNTPRDGGDNTPRDGGDNTPRDGGANLMPELVPGEYVQVVEGRVTIGTDTLASVQATLGAGMRGPANSRAYVWTLSGGVELNVWFANSSLGDVATINDTDTVLWAAVTGTYTGRTPQDVGIGSVRADVETAYGMAPNEVTIANPPGTLLEYFTTGVFIALDQAGATRTITICRAYMQEPDGTIDPNDARLRFNGFDIEGFRGLSGRGTRDRDVRARLGEPDAEGDITVSGQELHTLSYGFLGIEVFFVDNPVIDPDRTAFISVHAPYYGTTASGEGIGTDRTTFEAYLTTQGYGAGTPSSTNANFLCYTHGNDQDVGVSYSMPPQVVTSVSMPLLRCP